MKTIRMPNRESIAHSLKWIVAVFIGCCIVCIVYVGVCLYDIYITHFSYHDVRYESHEVVFELFESNTEDFENMVKLLDETDVLAKLAERWLLCEENFWQPEGNTFCNPLSQLKYSGFVTKEQLDEMVAFFEKYRPDNINYVGLNKPNAPGYRFHFWTKTYDVYIMNIESDEDMSEEIMKRYDYIKTASRISGQWYFALLGKI